MKFKYEGDLEELKRRLKETNNELVQHQEDQIRELMRDNA